MSVIDILNTTDRFAAANGSQLVEISEGRAVAEMTVEEKHLNGGNVCQGGGHANALSAEYGLSEFHFVHSVVDHHLQIVHLDGLLPKMGEKAEGEVAMGNSLAEWSFLGTFGVYVNPLMVEGGISEKIDAFL